MTPRLQILIASVFSRTDLLSELLASLAPTLSPYVQVLIDRDDAIEPVGVKRTRLVQAATADYVAFADDDDELAPDYVPRIIDALQAEPDCVGFYLAYQENGEQRRPAIHSLRFSEWADGLDYYERTPNHLNPLRREIALRGLPFRDGFGEDREWSDKIRPYLASESFIDWPPMYGYRYSRAGSLFGAGKRSLGFDPGLELPRFVHVLGRPTPFIAGETGPEDFTFASVRAGT